MNRTFSLLFYLKKSKALPDKKVPVYLRSTIDGKPTEISSKRYIEETRWNSKAQKVEGKSEDVRSFNDYLKTLERQVFDAHKALMDQGKLVTGEALKNKILGVKERPRTLVPIIKQHNRDIESLIGNGYSVPTLTKYNTTLAHFINFLQWKYKVSDVALEDLEYQTLTDFEFYLKSHKRIGQNTASKYIKNLKKIVAECCQKKWLKDNPFTGYKAVVLPTEATFLLEHELQALEAKEFSIERLSQVRDLFVFSCYTGLAFIDVFNLTANHVSIGIDGEKWIFTGRQKTNTPSHIPLLFPALQIIEKYKDHPSAVYNGKLFPMSSNQKMNAYLKEIADLCNIKKNLTFHVARHTFATTITLTNGVPIETVSKMLGHKKLQTTQHYAKILDKKVSNDMETLRSKYKSKLKIVSKKASGS